jgi:hypothetical protein
MPVSQDPRVPPEVEQILVEGYGAQARPAGELGAALGAFANPYVTGRGVAAGGKGAERGAKRAAGILRTKVEERTGVVPLLPSVIAERALNSIGRTQPIPAGAMFRMLVHFGMGGMCPIVVDIEATEQNHGTLVHVRAFGKEGLLSRHPTRRVADLVWKTLAA